MAGIGIDAGWFGSRGLRAAHLGAVPALRQLVERARNGLGQGGHLAKHDLDEIPDGVGGVSGPPTPFQPSVNEELKQVEGEGPKQPDAQNGVRGLPKNTSEIPILDPLVEPGVLEMPAQRS